MKKQHKHTHKSNLITKFTELLGYIFGSTSKWVRPCLYYYQMLNLNSEYISRDTSKLCHCDSKTYYIYEFHMKLCVFLVYIWLYSMTMTWTPLLVWHTVLLSHVTYRYNLYRPYTSKCTLVTFFMPLGPTYQLNFCSTLVFMQTPYTRTLNSL